MNLSSPVTVSIPNTDKTMTVSELRVILMDNNFMRQVVAILRPFSKPVVLWEGAAYDAIGDYTQALAEARILEVLGPDIKAGLEALFATPHTTTA